MVPDFRRDYVWTPAFAGVTLQETFYEIIKYIYQQEKSLKREKDHRGDSPSAQAQVEGWIDPWRGFFLGRRFSLPRAGNYAKIKKSLDRWPSIHRERKVHRKCRRKNTSSSMEEKKSASAWIPSW
jgi:hypothetical protein